MRLLLVASAPMEFRGILMRAQGRRRISIGADWAHTAGLSGHEVLLVANGVGARRAAAAVDAAWAVFPADRVISLGFCGALDPALRIADVIIGTCIAANNRRYSVLPLTGAAVASGIIRSIDRVAQTAAEKQALLEDGGIAVEMEAAGVAERAAARGLPFSCVKVVTDLAGEDMANDFNRALRSDGHFATMRIFGDALRHPAARIPELIRLQQRCVRAARTLGEFFADCRF
jgi:adenosylhomocysteine nucleosidase